MNHSTNKLCVHARCRFCVTQDYPPLCTYTHTCSSFFKQAAVRATDALPGQSTSCSQPPMSSRSIDIYLPSTITYESMPLVCFVSLALSALSCPGLFIDGVGWLCWPSVVVQACRQVGRMGVCRDYRGDGCPHTYIHTRLELEHWTHHCWLQKTKNCCRVLL